VEAVAVPLAEPAPVVAAPAAVLIALFEEAGAARVVLTRRSVQLRTHRGQVSFPGGRIEDGETAVAAALREAFEEVGLDPATARPFAELPRATAFASGAPITPVVAALDGRPALVANPAEVERVFDASLAELAASYWSERWSQPGRPTFTVHFFEAAGETVWGATARMLVELLTLATAGD
jgi:8-oxo-dGTP pyrophosphatase MutT (NUDIX family)